MPVLGCHLRYTGSKGPPAGVMLIGQVLAALRLRKPIRKDAVRRLWMGAGRQATIVSIVYKLEIYAVRLYNRCWL